MKIITLLTDFGTADWFVGTMKGVILARAPRARVVDLTHAVPNGDVSSGAFALAAACRFFPPGTVHVAVVDPGVGSGRAALVIKTKNYWFVGPDNGLLSLALAREKIVGLRRLENRRYFLEHVSQSFHGRDVFAPVAAHLVRGLDWRKLGPRTEEFQQLRWPALEGDLHRLSGEIVYVDQFGNGISNVPEERLRRPSALRIHVGAHEIGSLSLFYQAVPPGRPVALIGSSGFLEIAINGGSAARQLGLRVGTRVRVHW